MTYAVRFTMASCSSATSEYDFKGVEKTNVSEYCVSEGWIWVEVGKTKDRYGNPLTIKLTGPVEAFYKDKMK